ncbi:MAG: hypothetical protein ACKO83_04030, partial [Roseiflexaceae bacterium]
AVPESPLFTPWLKAGMRVWVSSDTRLHDLVAFGAVQGLRARGVLLSGSARPRFYTTLGESTFLPDAWLLGSVEEPESVGVTAADSVVTAAGAILYRRPATLIAAQAITPKNGMLTVDYNAAGVVLLDGVQVGISSSQSVTVVFDAAVLKSQRIGTQTYVPGAQMVTMTLTRGQHTQLKWDTHSANLVRMRIFDDAQSLPALQSRPFFAEAHISGDGLDLPDWDGEILLRGIEASSGRAVTHIMLPHTRHIAPSALALEAGQYQVVFVTSHGQQIVMANIIVDAQGWHWQVIPAQLMLVY